MVKSNPTPAQAAIGSDAAVEQPKILTASTDGLARELTAMAGGVPIVVPSEPTIRTICDGVAEYQGTRAMLESEGVIPANTKWPHGYADLCWEDGKYRYWLVRQRPEGAKGPRKLFVAIDWWCLRQHYIAEHYATRELKRKKQELADYAYRHSARGQAESSRRFNFYLEACKDEKFQAFKALIPGLIKPKRGRRPKNVSQSQGESTHWATRS